MACAQLVDQAACGGTCAVSKAAEQQFKQPRGRDLWSELYYSKGLFRGILREVSRVSNVSYTGSGAGARTIAGIPFV